MTSSRLRESRQLEHLRRLMSSRPSYDSMYRRAGHPCPRADALACLAFIRNLKHQRAILAQTWRPLPAVRSDARGLWKLGVRVRGPKNSSEAGDERPWPTKIRQPRCSASLREAPRNRGLTNDANCDRCRPLFDEGKLTFCQLRCQGGVQLARNYRCRKRKRHERQMASHP